MEDCLNSVTTGGKKMSQLSQLQKNKLKLDVDQNTLEELNRNKSTCSVSNDMQRTLAEDITTQKRFIATQQNMEKKYKQLEDHNRLEKYKIDNMKKIQHELNSLKQIFKHSNDRIKKIEKICDYLDDKYDSTNTSQIDEFIELLYECEDLDDQPELELPVVPTT